MNARTFAILAALLLAAVAPAAIAQQAAIQGSWTISPASPPDRFQFEMRSDDSHNSHGYSEAHLSSFGLTDAMLSTKGHVQFTIQREAGSFACEGWMSGDTNGGGTFQFTPSSAYLAAMRAKDYSLTSHDAMVAAQLDITTSYVDGIAAAGYQHLPWDKLIAFRALGIDQQYAQAMRSLFPDTGTNPEQIISLRALRVTPDYVTSMRSAGISIRTAHEAVELRALRVDSAYVSSMATVGYAHLTSKEAVQLRAMGIDADYVKRVQAHGYPNPTIEQLIRLKAMNIL